MKYEVQAHNGIVWRTVYLSDDLNEVRDVLNSIRLHYPWKRVRML
jgi:hypothetical protein